MPGNESLSPRAWLHGELAGLVKDGVLTEESAAALRGRYPLTSEADATLARQKRSTNWAMVLFGILGAVLIGGGIILLLAYNWEAMGRPARTVVAFAPLVLSQALAFWMLWTDRGATWGRETIGTFIALMVGACIALVSQTYHLGGDFAAFMLAWTLLSLPVAYLLGATLPAIWYCAAAVIWSFSQNWRHSNDALWFWPLLALVIPHWWLLARKNPYAARPVLLGWAIVGAGTFGVAIACVNRESENPFWVIAYAGWFAFLALAGRRWCADGRSIWQRPLQFVGVIGVATIALILTFDGVWRGGSRIFQATVPLAIWIAVFVWTALALLLWIGSMLRRDIPSTVIGFFPVLTLATMNLPDGATATQIIFNVFVFAIGVALLVFGLRHHQLGTVNGGMLILSALVLCRFFDSNLGFVLRGIVFILLGAGFLTMNFLLLRRKPATP
jgi:uncharacterized membrane protein